MQQQKVQQQYDQILSRKLGDYFTGRTNDPVQRTPGTGLSSKMALIQQQNAARQFNHQINSARQRHKQNMVATKPANMRQESTRKIAQKPIKNNEDVDKVSYESMEHKNQVLEAPPEDMRL